MSIVDKMLKWWDSGLRVIKPGQMVKKFETNKGPGQNDDASKDTEHDA